MLLPDDITSLAARVVAELFTANPFMVDGTFYLWDPLAAQLAAVKRAARDTTARLMGNIRTNTKIRCYEITSRLVKRRLRDRV